MNIKKILWLAALAASVPLFLFPQSEHTELTGNAERPRVALVLEGGGALGLAHIGVIQVIEELGIPVDIVTGTSMGSIVGALYASGYNAAELERVALETDWTDLFSEDEVAWEESYKHRQERSQYMYSVDFNSSGLLNTGGLLSGKKVLSYLDCLSSGVPSDIHFDDLPRRYRAIATDVLSGEQIVLEQGSLAEAMRASMSIPGVFEPYDLKGHSLVDGGLVNNLPVDIARSMGADIVIAVDLPGGFLTRRDVSDLNVLNSLSRTIEILVRTNVAPQLEQADFLITVPLEAYTGADFSKSVEIMELGRMAAEQAKEQLQAFISAKELQPSRSNGNGKNTLLFSTAGISRIRFKGGSAADIKSAEKIFNPVTGEKLDIADLTQRVSRLYQERPLDNIRLQRDAADNSVLNITLEPRNTSGHSIRLGAFYRGTYSSSVSSRISVVPGLVLRDLFREGLDLEVQVEMLGALGAELSAYQAFGQHWFMQASLSAYRDFDTYYASNIEESAVDLMLDRSALRLMYGFGYYPLPGSKSMLSFSRDFISDTTLPVYLPELVERDISFLQAAFYLSRLDNQVFPLEGLAFDIVFRQGLPVLGSARNFRTLSSLGEVHLSAGTPFSLGLIWNAGLDFSGRIDGPSAAPYQYKPDLADRRLFPNPLSSEERIGNLSIGGGFEAKRRLEAVSGALEVPVFLMAHAAAGAAYQEFEFTDWNDPVFHWNAALGAGIRFNDGLALLIRGGLSSGDIRNLSPYLAIDLGAISWKR